MNTAARILLIDDDPDIGMMLKMMLEYKNYTVTLLNKATTAEEILRKNDIDVVILDMLIAGVNGTEVCRLIKKDSLFSHIPILMISALPEARKICIDAGANDFISKPFEMNDILTKVNSLIGSVN